MGHPVLGTRKFGVYFCHLKGTLYLTITQDIPQYINTKLTY